MLIVPELNSGKNWKINTVYRMNNIRKSQDFFLLF